MAALLRFDLNGIAEYIEFVKKHCVAMQLRQETIEKSYIHLGECWQDEIYSKVGVTLYSTAKDLAKIYNGLKLSLAEVKRVHELLCDYNESNLRLNVIVIPDYIITLKGETSVKQHFIETDPEALMNFVHNLRTYIVDTRNCITTIKHEHANMGAYWRGQQYEEFGQVISETERRVKVQLDSLETYSILIDKKYRIYVDALGKSVNKF